MQSKLKNIWVLLVTFMVINSVGHAQKRNHEDEEDDLATLIAEYKQQAREALEPYRYDNSRVTYFVYKAFEQRIEIEMYMFNPAEYRFSFNGKAVEDAIKLEIYDKPINYKYRTMLYERESVAGDEFTFESDGLEEKYRSARMSDGMSEEDAQTVRLKRVFINYIIPSKAREEVIINEKTQEKAYIKHKGAMVVAIGYKNI